jgi:hypothetical protein
MRNAIKLAFPRVLQLLKVLHFVMNKQEEESRCMLAQFSIIRICYNELTESKKQNQCLTRFCLRNENAQNVAYPRKFYNCCLLPVDGGWICVATKAVYTSAG